MNAKITIRKVLTSEELESYRLDARRILGTEKAKSGEYLELPPPGDPVRKYAELILTLRDGEAAEVWVQGQGPTFANVKKASDQ